MRYPLVKQTSLKDCGPCSLASIIIFYKGYLSVDTLSEMMNTTRDGTTAYNLVETARKVGFEANGIREDSISNIKLPCIAHVINNHYNHFIVVYKVFKDKVVIGDPATSIKTISLVEFNKIWSHVVITLIPIKSLPCVKPKSLYNYMIDIFKANLKSFLIISIVSFIFIILSFTYSIYIKYLIDNINVLNNKMIFIIILIIIVKILFLYLKTSLVNKMNKSINVLLNKKIINNLILLPYPYYRNHTTGEILSRFNDVESIKEIISSFLNVIVIIPLLIIFIIYLFLINRLLFNLLLIILVIYILISNILIKKTNITIKDYQKNKALFSSLFVESINGFETIKGLNKESFFINKLNHKYNNLENSIYCYSNIQNIKEVIQSIIVSLGNILILLYSYKLYINNIISIGSIVTYYLVFGLLINEIDIINTFIQQYKAAVLASNKIQELGTKEIKSENIVSNYNIKFHKLNYNIGLKPILKNITLFIKEGDKVFITGPSGSGKSTLVKLIKGYYQENNLKIDKNNCSNLNEILYISQNEILFTNSIYNNLLCDDGKKIEDIVKLCLINKDINTYIEENGFNISGGEKERIILGRTLLQNFKILIIDEGLTQLDINKERIILKNLFDKYKDKTIIVISHRLDNIDLYNHFIEMNDGRIVKNIYKHFN